MKFRMVMSQPFFIGIKPWRSHTTRLGRRLGVILYDAMLLFSVLFVATVVGVLCTGGEAVDPKNRLFSAYLIMICFLYFTWPWVHCGQTLGMKTWHVYLRTCNGKPISWGHAALRFVAALGSWLPFGLGFLWSLVDKEKLAWHDRLSDTVLITVEPKKRAP